MYSIQVTSDLTKNRQPVQVQLPANLYCYYESTVRPVRVAQAIKKGQSDEQQIVFCGERIISQPAWLDTWVRELTERLLGRRIKMHHFRHSLVSIIYNSPHTPQDMAELALVMGHSPETQAKYYKIQDLARVALKVTDHMHTVLDTATRRREPIVVASPFGWPLSAASAAAASTATASQPSMKSDGPFNACVDGLASWGAPPPLPQVPVAVTKKRAAEAPFDADVVAFRAERVAASFLSV